MMLSSVSLAFIAPPQTHVFYLLETKHHGIVIRVSHSLYPEARHLALHSIISKLTPHQHNQKSHGFVKLAASRFHGTNRSHRLVLNSLLSSLYKCRILWYLVLVNQTFKHLKALKSFKTY